MKDCSRAPPQFFALWCGVGDPRGRHEKLTGGKAGNYDTTPGEAGKRDHPGEILYICSQVYCQKKLMSNKNPEENLAGLASA